MAGKVALSTHNYYRKSRRLGESLHLEHPFNLDFPSFIAVSILRRVDANGADPQSKGLGANQIAMHQKARSARPQGTA